MCTYLGAASLLTPEDVDPAVIKDGRVTYMEGYLFDRPPKQAFFHAAALAHQAGRCRGIGQCCVDRHRASSWS